MDRTSRIGLAVCLIVFVVLTLVQNIYYPLPKKLPHKPVAALTNGAPENPPNLTAAQPSQPNAPAPAPAPAPVQETISTLENDAVKVTFTSLGAAIKNVELKLQKADNGGNIILNQEARSNVMTLSGWPGADSANFTAQQDATSITFTTTLPGGLQWQRKYAFGEEPDRYSGLGGFLRRISRKIGHMMGRPDPKVEIYTLDVTDTVTNPGATDVTLPGYVLSVGRAEPLFQAQGNSPTPVPSPLNNMYCGSGWLTTKFHLTTVNDFNPSSLFWVFPTRAPRDTISSTDIDNAPLEWVGVENQFFVMLLTPSVDKSINRANFSVFNPRNSDGMIPRTDVPDIEAAANFAAVTVPAGKSATLAYNLYAGPKDFNRLDALGQSQGELMNYDGILPFSWLIVPMLTVLRFWYSIFNNYGVAIILLTLMIKAITWPLQSKANHAGKKMQALAPMLKELQAKYKEEPEKLQKETFALYRDYGVNPFGGCWPAMVQMPVFFSLYFMLQNAVELRGQSFLWVHDLTKPDAIVTFPFSFLGIDGIHPLPIMVTALTMVMMRMTPQIGDPQQAKIAQFMPVVFLFVFYNFAAALSLYYVINNCVSIFQIYRNLKKPLPPLRRRDDGDGPSSSPSRRR
jgi:YidC/Oxa1 family membrane protein insertase